MTQYRQEIGSAADVELLNRKKFIQEMRAASTDLKDNLKYSFGTLFNTFRMKRMLSAFDKQIDEIAIRVAESQKTDPQTEQLVIDAYKSLINLETIARPEKKSDVQALRGKMETLMAETTVVSVLTLQKFTDFAQKLFEGLILRKNGVADRIKTDRHNRVALQKGELRAAINELASPESLQTSLFKMRSVIEEQRKITQDNIDRIELPIKEKARAVSELENWVKKLEYQSKYAVKCLRTEWIKDDTSYGPYSNQPDEWIEQEIMGPDFKAREEAVELLTQARASLTEAKRELSVMLSDNAKELSFNKKKMNILFNEDEILNASISWLEKLSITAKTCDTAAINDSVEKSLMYLKGQLHPDTFYKNMATIFQQQLNCRLDVKDTLQVLKNIDPSPNALLMLRRHLPPQGQTKLAENHIHDTYLTLVLLSADLDKGVLTSDQEEACIKALGGDESQKTLLPKLLERVKESISKPHLAKELITVLNGKTSAAKKLEAIVGFETTPVAAQDAQDDSYRLGI